MFIDYELYKIKRIYILAPITSSQSDVFCVHNFVTFLSLPLSPSLSLSISFLSLSMQYPLDVTQYSDVIKQINTIVLNHTHSVGTLPPSQIDPTDYSGKIAPCCDHTSNCTCVPHETVAMEMTSGRSGHQMSSWIGNLLKYLFVI